MEYIAIAIPREETESTISKIDIVSKDYDLKFVYQDITNIDTEVKNGVIPFANLFNLILFQIIQLSTSNKNKTSSDVNRNLVDFFIKKEKASLIELLMENKDILPKKYFIIFAFEWHNGELCRYKKINIRDLENYFLENNSWYLWLYDYSKNYEQPDLDIPLILEIENE